MTLRRLRTAVCLLAVLSGGGAAGGGSSGGGSGSAGSAGSTGGAAAASSVDVSGGPAANSVAPARNGGGGIDAGGDPSGATSLQGVLPYSLRPIYFRRDQFRSPADCLTAAHTRRLPLEVCQ